MKHLTKFIEYLVESTDISSETIDELLFPIREDIGIKCEVHDPVTITEGKYSGREYRKIVFDITELQYMGGFGYADALVDNRTWELFSEIISLKERLGSDMVALDINTLRKRMGISFITKSPVKSGVDFELERLYRKLMRKSMDGKSDFINNMVIKLDKKDSSINITVSMSYTDRKWRLFVREFDLSEYNIDIKTEKSSYILSDLSAVIKITPKK